MRDILKNSLESFKSFLNKQGNFIVFTCLFYSLWLVQSIANDQHFVLHSFKGRMIGIATLEGYDIGQRVSLFYKCAGILLGSFFVFSLAGYLIFKKFPALLQSVETKIINYLSLAGIIFYLCGLFNCYVKDSIEVLYSFHRFMLVAILLRLVLFRKTQPNVYNYTLVILLSVSLFYLVRDCFFFSAADSPPEFPNTTLIIAGLLFIGLGFLLKKDPGQAGVNKIAYYLLPLMLLPVATILKDEIYLICKARHLAPPDLLLLYILLLAVLAGIVLLRIRRFKKRGGLMQKELLARYYFPLFIFSVAAFSKYSYYTYFSTETFELANKYLPIMEFKLFNVIPTLEKFNSHVLSDYFFSAIYTFLNGLQWGSEMVLYDFLYPVISCVLYYFLLFYLSRNAFIAFFGAMLFPFSAALLPESFSFGVFAVFALHRIITQKPSLKNYLVFFLTLGGLILWRIDLGYACVYTMPALLVYYHLRSKTFRIQPRLLIMGALSVLGITLLTVVGFCLYRGANLFEKLPYALNYLSSFQTYGLMSLGDPAQVAYKMHYYVFPVTVAIILLTLIIKYPALNKSRGQRLAYLSLLFICGFYFANFNRGLVRHGLIENTDLNTSSYIYLIIPGAFLVFFHNRTQVFRCCGLFAIAFFLIVNYKLPNPYLPRSFFETSLEFDLLKQPADLPKIQSRVIHEPDYKDNKDSAFIRFIHEHTTPDETFIDFSNNPMLFFYTQKITPSYFYQNPLCSHNEFLQKRFVADLKDYNTPWLVFNSTDSWGMDAVDIVPNPLRHYRMAEYFYRNYTPYVIAGRFSVWKNNAAKDFNKKDTVYRFSANPDSLGIISLKTELNCRPGKKYLARLVLAHAGNSVLLKTTLANDSSVTQAPEFVDEEHGYFVLSGLPGPRRIELQNVSDTISSFHIIECDYIPDYHAEKFHMFYLTKLPYLWGTYDKEISQEPVIFKQTFSAEDQKYRRYSFKVPQKLDKSTGNTVLVTLKNRSDKLQSLLLSFGKAGAKHGTRIYFTVPPSMDKEERYAIRVSSIYKWYSDLTDEMWVYADNDDVVLKDIKITKGL